MHAHVTDTTYKEVSIALVLYKKVLNAVSTVELFGPFIFIVAG